MLVSFFRNIKFDFCIYYVKGIDSINYSVSKFFDRHGTVDMQVVHAFESVVIDWTYQINDVLKKDSSQPILEGKFPTPKFEVAFWKAKADNLECVYDQVMV